MNDIVTVYLASPRAAGWLKWSRLDCLCASIRLLTKLAPTPVIVFHEDYTDEDKLRLSALAENVSFEKIDFSTHLDYFSSRRPTERVGSYGYLMMCRFFTGIVQAHPALQAYSHYIRLDDDSYLMTPLGDSVMSRIKAAHYSFRSTYHDFGQESLWEYTRNFMCEEGLPVDMRALNMRGLLHGNDYSGMAIFTNFHASSLALWKHPTVSRYVSGIEEQHGCLSKGWFDSNIQAMMAFVLCPALGLAVNEETGFDYRHNHQCSNPSDLTKYPWGPPDE